ncbi:MAG: hydantoinase B/oxoprolinase family protein, partial [Bdellovibrionales bacterium]|nr:hydantoinase B/oxoprolinase family protein [Bdellovibrionales bacterium]
MRNLNSGRNMQDAFYFAQLNSFFERWFEPYRAAALMTNDNLPIFIKYQNLPDIGTLPVVTETVGKYLKIGPGDIVLTNDPYSGGSTLTAMTLMMGVSLEPKRSSSSADFLFCVRFNLKPHLQMTQTVEDEGVRIPPTPIRHGGQINEDLLRVIADHPQCPKDFLQSTDRMIKAMDNTIALIQKDTIASRLDWSKPRIKQYFRESSRLFSHQLGRIAFGEASREMSLESGERLRLNLR